MAQKIEHWMVGYPNTIHEELMRAGADYVSPQFTSKAHADLDIYVKCVDSNFFLVLCPPSYSAIRYQEERPIWEVWYKLDKWLDSEAQVVRNEFGAWRFTALQAHPGDADYVDGKRVYRDRVDERTTDFLYEWCKQTGGQYKSITKADIMGKLETQRKRLIEKPKDDAKKEALGELAAEARNPTHGKVTVPVSGIELTGHKAKKGHDK
jgi:hypothetical protein